MQQEGSFWGTSEPPPFESYSKDHRKPQKGFKQRGAHQIYISKKSLCCLVGSGLEGQEPFLEDQQGDHYSLSNWGWWWPGPGWWQQRQRVTQIEEGRSSRGWSPSTIPSRASEGFPLLSRKDQIVNTLYFAGIQEGVTIVGMMLPSSRVCLQDFLLTSVRELG